MPILVRVTIIVVTGLRFSGFSGFRVLELFVRVLGRVSGLIYKVKESYLVAVGCGDGV